MKILSGHGTYLPAAGTQLRAIFPAPNSPFCTTHTPKPDAAAELVRDLDQFHTAGDVAIFLSRLLAAASKGEVSTRRASVPAYISISLLQALRSMAKQSGLDHDGLDYDPVPLACTIMIPASRTGSISMTLAPSSLNAAMCLVSGVGASAPT